jgi:hypothetical protein
LPERPVRELQALPSRLEQLESPARQAALQPRAFPEQWAEV